MTCGVSDTDTVSGHWSAQSPVSRCVMLVHDIVTIVTNLVTCGQLLTAPGAWEESSSELPEFKFRQKMVLIINSRIKCGTQVTINP